jgi:hypothetical protein
MITDVVVVEDIRKSWSTVEKLSTECLFSRATPAGWSQANRPDDAFNLPFLLAYACLDQALSALQCQGAFKSKSSLLGAKMEASRSLLAWHDYEHVDAGKELRNRLAHEAELVSKQDALRYIAAVRRELHAWSVLDGDCAQPAAANVPNG